MRWVTRENANVDRIACPWLIRRFIDAEAEFLYVPADQVMEVADREGPFPMTCREWSWAMSRGAARSRASCSSTA